MSAGASAGICASAKTHTERDQSRDDFSPSCLRYPTSMEEETSATRNPKTNLLENLIEGHGRPLKSHARSWKVMDRHGRSWKMIEYSVLVTISNHVWPGGVSSVSRVYKGSQAPQSKEQCELSCLLQQNRTRLPPAPVQMPLKLSALLVANPGISPLPALTRIRQKKNRKTNRCRDFFQTGDWF